MKILRNRLSQTGGHGDRGPGRLILFRLWSPSSESPREILCFRLAERVPEYDCIVPDPRELSSKVKSKLIIRASSRFLSPSSVYVCRSRFQCWLVLVRVQNQANRMKSSQRQPTNDRQFKWIPARELEGAWVPGATSGRSCSQPLEPNDFSVTQYRIWLRVHVVAQMGADAATWQYRNHWCD